MATMNELIKEVPDLVRTIDKFISKNGEYVFHMYGSYKSTTGRIDEKYKDAIREWCRCYGYRFEDLRDFYHCFRITQIQ